MKTTFEPNYQHITDCAWNKEATRIPLYEHNVSFEKISQIIQKDITPLFDGSPRELEEFFYHYCHFFKDHGYDAVTFECCIGHAMPGAGALGDSRISPVIKDRSDFNHYPFDEIPNYFFDKFGKYFEALQKQMPAGMKAIGGVGNGIFECVQDLVGYQNLCYLSIDDEELYTDLFKQVGKTNLAIWSRFMEEFHDLFCVLRFGDDLGYKSTTLLPPNDVKQHILPQYKPIVDLVHSYNKPFLLHSCGNIFHIMEDILAIGINAKHSNEDQIAPFSQWVNLYGDRIGNFGGIDLDVVCNASKQEMREYIEDVIKQCSGHGGFAFGSGNSIPTYVPADGYLTLIEIVRELRGDFKA